MKPYWLICVSMLSAWFAATLWQNAYGSGRSCSASDIRAYEAILGVARGGYRTIPQLGFTIQYIGTRPMGNGVCAVLVRRAD